MNTCQHDERFRILGAKNGCLACQCELEARMKTQTRQLVDVFSMAAQDLIRVIDTQCPISPSFFDLELANLRALVERYEIQKKQQD